MSVDPSVEGSSVVEASVENSSVVDSSAEDSSVVELTVVELLVEPLNDQSRSALVDDELV